jgi:hypothetical protein
MAGDDFELCGAVCAAAMAAAKKAAAGKTVFLMR